MTWPEARGCYVGMNMNTRISNLMVRELSALWYSSYNSRDNYDCFVISILCSLPLKCRWCFPPLHYASWNTKNRIKNECTNGSVAVRLYRINAGGGKTVRAELKGKCDDKKIVFPPLFASSSWDGNVNAGWKVVCLLALLCLGLRLLAKEQGCWVGGLSAGLVYWKVRHFNGFPDA